MARFAAGVFNWLEQDQTHAFLSALVDRSLWKKRHVHRSLPFFLGAHIELPHHLLWK
jgi:hypothetical protein